MRDGAGHPITRVKTIASRTEVRSYVAVAVDIAIAVTMAVAAASASENSNAGPDAHVRQQFATRNP